MKAVFTNEINLNLDYPVVEGFIKNSYIPYELLTKGYLYYYCEDRNSLIQFKTICICPYGGYEFQILIEEPNGALVWISYEKYRKLNFFLSKEDYFEFLNDNSSHRYSPKTIAMFSMLENVEFYNSILTLKDNCWIWQNGSPSSVSNSLLPKHLIIHRNGCLICVNKVDYDGNKVFLSKKDCINYGLNGFKVIEFKDDNTISLDIHKEKSYLEYKVQIMINAKRED